MPEEAEKNPVTRRMPTVAGTSSRSDENEHSRTSRLRLEQDRQIALALQRSQSRPWSNVSLPGFATE